MAHYQLLLNKPVGNILRIHTQFNTSSFKAASAHRPLFSCSALHRSHATSAGHVRVHVNYMCGACAVAKPSTPLSSERLAEVHFGFSQVSLAQFLLNVCFLFSCQNLAVSHEETTGDTMSDGEIFKAEKVFIRESAEGGAGNVIKPGTEHQVSTTRTRSMSCGNYGKKRTYYNVDMCLCKTVYMCIYAG